MKTQNLSRAAVIALSFAAGFACDSALVSRVDKALAPGCVAAYAGQMVNGVPVMLPVTVCSAPASPTPQKNKGLNHAT